MLHYAASIGTVPSGASVSRSFQDAIADLLNIPPDADQGGDGGGAGDGIDWWWFRSPRLGQLCSSKGVSDAMLAQLWSARVEANSDGELFLLPIDSHEESDTNRCGDSSSSLSKLYSSDECAICASDFARGTTVIFLPWCVRRTL